MSTLCSAVRGGACRRAHRGVRSVMVFLVAAAAWASGHQARSCFSAATTAGTARRGGTGLAARLPKQGRPWPLHFGQGGFGGGCRPKGTARSRRTGLIADLLHPEINVLYPPDHTHAPKLFDLESEGASTGSRSWVDRLGSLLDSGLGSVLMLGAAGASVALANCAATKTAWLGLWATRFGPRVGAHALTLRGWVNEGLMCLFFFSVGLEIKKEMVEGALASPRQALLPCIAACGGMIIPVLVYTLVNVVMPGGVVGGASIPMATDIAFALGVFHFFRNHMPAAAEPFLLALATVDDLGAIAVIACCFAGSLAPGYLLAAVAILAATAASGKRGVETTGQFVIPAVALWYCLLRGGLSADIAGVLIAFCIPMRSSRGTELVGRLIKNWGVACALLVLPIFALANCAVPLASSSAAGVGAAVSAQLAVPAGVSLGLLLGKPLGIFGFSYLAIRLGFASMPPGMRKRDLGIVGILGSIGFTMCLFLIESALHGPTAQYAKLAVFLASITGALVGAGFMALQPCRKVAMVSSVA